MLGCATAKEFCARFAASNPMTTFVPQNAYKWLRGKAMPRASSVYDDWALVLGGTLAAPFLASSSFDEFQDAVRAHFAVPDAALSALRGEAGLPLGLALAGGDPLSLSRGQPRSHRLEGAYLAISPAWSQAQTGRLIVGMVSIHSDAMQRLQISYSENLFNRQVVMTGALQSDGYSAQGALVCSYTRRLFFLSLNVPAAPADLIGGILCGAAVHDADARATACRILLLRAPGGRAGDLVARTGYLDADAGLVGRELAVLGYRDEAARLALGACIVAVLSAPSRSCLCAVEQKELAPLEYLAPFELLQ